jgi:hypothetical protein
MAFTRIEDSDLENIGVIGLPDTPGLSTAAMQNKFEETARSVIVPKHNGLMDELEASTSASDLGATPVTGRASSPTVQGVLDKLSADLKTVEDGMGEAIADAHTHDNKALLDTYDQTNTDITDAITKKHDHSNKALLDTYTQTETDLSNAVSKAHDHSNKSLLDSYTQTETDIADAVSKKHEHSNKTYIDKISEDSGGNMTYNGSPISGTITDAYDEFDVSSGGSTTTISASGADKLTIKAGANVTLAANATTKEITISSTGGGGGGGGDMYEADYDNSGTVKAAGGIDSYVATEISGKQDTLSAGTGITISSNTVGVDFGTIASGATKPVTGGDIYTALQSKADTTDIPDALADLTTDVTITGTPTQGQALIVNSSGKFENQTLPSGGHQMVDNTPEADMIDEIANSTSSNQKVVSAYGVKNWSNCEVKNILVPVSQGVTGVGSWDDDWKTASPLVRTGWVWHKELYQILKDGNNNDVTDIKIEPVFLPADDEVVGLYAYRIDDDYTLNGEHGGCVAFKFTGKIQSANGTKVGVQLTHLRTEDFVGTIIS